jgi:hypothetical protein
VPPNRRALEPVGALPRDQGDKVERVVQGEAAQLPGRQLGGEEVAVLDGAREPSVRGALRGHEHMFARFSVAQELQNPLSRHADDLGNRIESHPDLARSSDRRAQPSSGLPNLGFGLSRPSDRPV